MNGLLMAFALGGYLLMKMHGFALAATVLIGATLVRLTSGPALLQLASLWNWWLGGQIARRSFSIDGPSPQHLNAISSREESEVRP